MTETDSLKNDCEVLVVGAGPTGLMAASLLRRSGVDVRIVEQRAEASRESRAFAVMARSMELFAQMGLAERVLERAVVAPGIDVFVRGQRVGGIDYDHVEADDTPYRFITLHPQAYTEEVLIEDLTRQGLEVERGVTVTALRQDGAGVEVDATGADGAPVRIRSRYAIGADGAHSVARKALALPFEGGKYDQTFMLADCEVTWPLDHAHFRIFLHGSTLGLFLPLQGQARSRVMTTDPSNRIEQGGAEASHLDLAELEAAFRQVTGMEVTLSRPTWTTRYRVSHRGVPHYGVGRVFLAGDAAHIHSPAGGQGMNTGLQDAANLAWKLAVVLRGGPERLLETYDSERRPVGEDVVRTSDRMFTAVAGQSGFEATLRDWIARPVSAAMSHLTGMERRAFRKLAQLEIDYGRHDFAADMATGLGSDGPQVGRRAPNAAISRHLGVFDLLAGYGFKVLAFSRKPLERDDAHHAAAALASLTGHEVEAHLVTRLTWGQDEQVVTATAAEVFDAYGLKARDAQAIYVIRPDGYIAWRGDGLDIEGCRRFLARFGLQVQAGG